MTKVITGDSLKGESSEATRPRNPSRRGSRRGQAESKPGSLSAPKARNSRNGKPRNGARTKAKHSEGNGRAVAGGRRGREAKAAEDTEKKAKELAVLNKKLAALKQEIEKSHDGYLDSCRTAIQHALVAGRHLLKVKDLVGHGGFGAWIEANCPFSQSTANVYMRIAKEAPKLGLDGNANHQSTVNLKIVEALKILARSQPDAAEDQAGEQSEKEEKSSGRQTHPSTDAGDAKAERAEERDSQDAGGAGDTTAEAGEEQSGQGKHDRADHPRRQKAESEGDRHTQEQSEADQSGRDGEESDDDVDWLTPDESTFVTACYYCPSSGI